MCQAYESEARFLTWLEQNGYAHYCKTCFRWSHMVPNKCSWCDVFKVTQAGKGVQGGT